MLSSSYRDEKLEDGSERTVLALPPFLAHVKLAILPLVKKDGLPNKAMENFNSLRFDHNIIYEEKDSIGKRYRRQDAIGTPYCITIDRETPDRQLRDLAGQGHDAAGAGAYRETIGYC